MSSRGGSQSDLSSIGLVGTADLEDPVPLFDVPMTEDKDCAFESSNPAIDQPLSLAQEMQVRMQFMKIQEV